jgi:Uma2 family endonuclease
MTAEPVEHRDIILGHRGPWTEEQYLALPEDSLQHTELIDGDLVVTPSGDVQHQRFIARLWRELERLLPDDAIADLEVNLRLRHGRIVGPDVVIARELSEGLVVNASNVVLVAEVVSPGGKARDRILKPALYAEAGIPWYLRVEREPRLELVLSGLNGPSYVEHARAAEGETLTIPDLSVTIEVDALLRRR